MPEAPVILNVNDDEGNRYAVTRMLQRAGYEVIEAATGEQALEMVQLNPALVILDVHLPDISGFEVCRRIKDDPARSLVIVLHLSAVAVFSGDRVHGLEGGADAYLTQPVEPAELLATVRALLRLREAEAEAQSRALQWQSTFDAISDAVWLVDNEGRVLRCNRAMTELLRMPVESVLGRSAAGLLRDSIGPVDVPAVSGESRSRGALEIAVQGRWLRITADPVSDAAGNPGGAVHIFSDITDRKHAEEGLRTSNDRLQFLSETAGDLLRSDDPGEFTRKLFDRVSAQMGLEVYLVYLFAGDRDALVLQSYGGIPEEVAQAVRWVELGEPGCGSAPTPGEPVVREDVQHSSDPATEFVRALGITAYACYPLLVYDRLIGTFSFGSRKQVGFDPDELALVQTICDQVAMALERHRLISELQHRHGQLMEADRRKDEFLAMLAHELRNPLGAITNALHILEQIGAPQGREAQLRSTMERQLGNLTRMVDDLLDVSRIERGKIVLRRQPVEVAAVTHQAIHSCQGLIDARGHQVRVSLPDQPVWVRADPTRLEQIVSNLVNNAAKYTEPGGRIEVVVEREDAGRTSLALSQPAGPMVRIRVRDTGIGIPEEMLPRIFDLFAQVDQSLDRSRGGLGIGLTLVRRLVEMHGGTIGVWSEGPGRGSEFTVRLPAVAAPAAAEGPDPEAPDLPAPAPSASGGVPHAVANPMMKRVLVVEDNVDARETLRDLLELFGYAVEIAPDGEAGVERALSLRPDVALVDIGLPGLDGYEVARQVRAALDGVRLIALTGYGQEEDRRRALDAGFDDHLVKPINPEELNRLLAEA